MLDQRGCKWNEMKNKDTDQGYYTAELYSIKNIYKVAT